jgi:hypothetical protein
MGSAFLCLLLQDWPYPARGREREREREREEQHMMFFLFNIAGKESHWFECPKTMGLALDAHVRVPTPKC